MLALSGFSQTKQKPAKPAKAGPAKVSTTKQVAKPKALTTKQGAGKTKAPDEKTQFEQAVAITDGVKRLTALKKFVAAFPQSARAAEAAGHIVQTGIELGNERLQAADTAAAAEFFKAAATAAPKPLPAALFADKLSQLPSTLYFRGERQAAVNIAALLEDKVSSDPAQLLELARFYLSIENGSEAKRLAGAAVALAPASSPAYQTLGLSHRMDFELDEAAAAYAKAVELDPSSVDAKRGLAEMMRSLGKGADAALLYREILQSDTANTAAKTGLILSLFDSGERRDAEAELTQALEADAANVPLLSGAAYWYASNGEGEKAVSMAKTAIAADPRFIWSHIALARGYLSLNNSIDAERTLLAARRYGNFPTLQYEIASAQLAAGLYRDAADELSKSFSIRDGSIHTSLGGRVPRTSGNFTELVGFERRASIFAPTAADSPENATRLTALLAMRQALEAAEPSPEVVKQAVDDFVKGGDKMKVHRQIFAAGELLDKKVAPALAIELAKAAVPGVEAGLDIPAPAVAVMGSELYDSRRLAAAQNAYVNVPPVAKPTLSSVLRGRIEELNGWALMQLNDTAGAETRLKRAVGVLPANSAWWRSSNWRLGQALAMNGKDAEALDVYIKGYKSGGPDIVRYSVIQSLYTKVHGSTEGLEAKIGPDPAARSAEATAGAVQPAPTADPPASADATPAAVPVTTAAEPAATPAVPAAANELPRGVPVATPVPSIEATPEPGIHQTSEPAAAPDKTPDPSPTVEATPAEAKTPEPSPTVEATPAADKTPEPAPAATPETSLSAPTGDGGSAAVAVASPKTEPADKLTNPTKTESKDQALFPPVVISIPPPEKAAPRTKKVDARPAASPTTGAAVEAKPVSDKGSETPAEKIPAVTPCTISVSEESVSLQNGAGDLAVVVGLTDDGDLEGLTAVSTSPERVSVRREVINGVRTRAIFVLRATGEKSGVYQVRFEMPCGTKEIVVKVR